MCGRTDASALARGAADARGCEAIEDTVDAGALRDAVPPEIACDAPPFCSIILIASSGVGMSAT
jgi:hypothetical protein